MSDGQCIFETCTKLGEKRTIELEVKSNGIIMREHTSGPDTELIYGEPSHTQMITIALSEMDQLRSALDLGDGPVANELAHIFKAGQREWLSELQSVLERFNVRYTYAAFGDSGGAFRPPLDYNA